MLPSSAIVTFVILITVLSKNVQPAPFNHGKEEKGKILQTFLGNVNPAVPFNMTYIERGENVLKVPNFQSNDGTTPKKKLTKKSPKSTIQKIIKKNRTRRRMFVNQATTLNPLASGDEMDNFYAQEELAQRNENSSAQSMNHKKKRKSTKITRYQMPFKKLQSMREHKRNRRSAEKDNRELFVLTDLDEIEFLKENKDEDIVKAHVKNYW